MAGGGRRVTGWALAARGGTRRGSRRDAPGLGGPAVLRADCCAAPATSAARRGARPGRRTGGGADLFAEALRSRRERRALVRGGAAPAPGRAAARASGRGRGDAEALPARRWRSPGHRGQAVGAARRRVARPALGRPGRAPEARDLLAPVYGWFTEGFDTRGPAETRRRCSTSFGECCHGARSATRASRRADEVAGTASLVNYPGVRRETGGR